MKTNPQHLLVSRALAASVLLLAGLAHATTANAELQSAELSRDGQALNIRWQAPATVDVYLADTPDAPAAKRKLISKADADGVHRLELKTDARPYVWLQPKHGEGQWVAERVLPLQGGRNFRDMGGYETVDGRRVAWGKIYRSGTMANFTDADYDYLRSLDIAVMCDLRSPQEREFEPTQWQRIDPALQYLAWEQPLMETRKADADDGGPSLADMMRKGPVTDPELTREAFKHNYRHGAYEFKQQYTAVFDQLAQGKAPLAFNCSAGKDRTGRIAALLLSALGVPREVVVADYAMSDDVVDFEKAFAAPASNSNTQKRESPFRAMMEQWSPEARAVLLSSEPEFIEAMFEQIEKDYGSVENFLERELGVDDAKLAQLKARYLEG